jgi:hypothetical protein
MLQCYMPLYVLPPRHQCMLTDLAFLWLRCRSPVRIVNVASTAHMFGKMNFDDLQSRNDYDRWRAYGKLHAPSSTVC